MDGKTYDGSRLHRRTDCPLAYRLRNVRVTKGGDGSANQEDRYSGYLGTLVQVVHLLSIIY